MSITNNVASFLLGLIAFDTPVPRDPGVLAAIAASGVLIAVGVVGVANASITRRLYHADASPETGDAAEPDVGRRAVL